MSLSEDVAGEKLDLLQAGEDSLQQIATQAHSVVKDAKSQLSALENAIVTRNTLLENVRRFILHLERSCNTLIAFYRDENRRTRDEPPPAYFQESWVYPVPDAFKVDMEEDMQKLISQRESMSAIERAYTDLHEVQAELYEKFRGDVRDLFEKDSDTPDPLEI